MKVELKHVKAHTVCGYCAIYVVRLVDGTVRNFGGDYKAAHAFVSATNRADVPTRFSGPTAMQARQFRREVMAARAKAA